MRRCVTVTVLRRCHTQRIRPLYIGDTLEWAEPASEWLVRWDDGSTTRIASADTVPMPTVCETAHAYARRLRTALQARTH